MNEPRISRIIRMKKLLMILLALLPLLAFAQVEVTNLRVENWDEPLGIDTSEPRFSWQMTSDKKIATPHSDRGSENVRQTAYQIVVSGDQGELWNSGRIESNQQLWVPYGGQSLKSNTHCTWKVKVWTTAGETAWSSEKHFSIGLLSESKWSGYWIGLEQLLPGEERGFHTRMAARYLRKEFQLKDKDIKRATAYVAGIGLHEF